MRGILDRHGDELSDLAKRRVELFINSAEFFAPDLKKENIARINLAPQ